MILSIESSCDDSSIAITRIKDKKLIFHKKISQESSHKDYGGVVPELASRLHAKLLPQILKECKEFLNQLKAIAVTTEPGLSVTLLEGVVMAQSLAYALNLPLISVNHLKGHIYSLFLEKDSIFPLGILLVSGGHTMLLESKGLNETKIIAQSIDDSFGESFDKVAKMLSLGYPGGPIVELRAKMGNANISLPQPLNNKNNLAFSFSGLKNAVRLEIEKNTINDNFINDICASFQKVAISHIVQKCKTFFELNKQSNTWQHFAIVGGASANLSLREQIQNLADSYNKQLLLAPLSFCSDNAAMIGRVAVESYLIGDFVDIKDIKITPKIQSF
ncbi:MULTISPECIES: tRNA (adenosine(37)-N6)-threonylcarbamoyltransferase complex transferase subunit TsaD [Helicobacter]|uniref:tRNA N6-adenosine threonylcarbamoyltransferase n=1 Tax=Helicobacter ibis TaxID=2962633 RepID=A0ABT4VBU6_9HELI|nr:MULTISPECIES: tRNA (adenosine(37)-N6)-threonylcarbamoyltransferase complex transferase subunit TsaD [Helicobacter]MDA3966950.1 tRNA (adenosine(37)-N6)-threonylcarbamoyltransferase complex transferase subunit TsaD [Helicobacter sp. WB40]MDA3968176.1 tRNA (adenosine(37)-N6)-threonylcarbamoyltransferase complex transferase subunit TsaD [Helicobacter ibis]